MQTRAINVMIGLTLLLPILIGCSTDTPEVSKTPEPSTPNKNTQPQADGNTSSPQTTQPTVEIKEGWGGLKGRFALKGTAPTASAITITKDNDVCGKHDLRDESLVVNQSNGGISGVVIWLYVKRGDDAPAIHPSYEESAKSEVLLDNLQCRFEPHVCLLRTTQTLVVKNSDPVGHNTKIDTQSNPPINRTIPAGGDMTQGFESMERLPAPVSCSIHPWMKGWLVIQDTPYCAVTDADGNFEIQNIPSGEWTFQFWQEGAGYIDEVRVKGAKQEWKKGRAEFIIQGDSTNDLGDVVIDAAMFK